MARRNMSSEFSNAPRVRLYEFVADEIEKAITLRKFLPGAKLPSEKNLANQFEVSRTVVREAFKILKERHLITVEDGRGAFVLSPSSSGPTEALSRYINRISPDMDYEALYETRLLIEPENAFIAAERANPKDIEKLNDCMDRLYRFRDDPDKWIQADCEFHAAIAEATNNPYMKVFIETLLDHMVVIFGGGFIFEGAVDATVEMHGLIAENIEAKKPEAAKEMMRKHIEQSREVMRKALNKVTKESFDGDQ
jgi:GntR family transcriptional repressor for pyruvate dehydrogenase complex